MTVDERAPEGRIERAVPAVGWLRSYDRSWLVNDLVGGVAAGSVVIPQAMAYAAIADLPPEVGLYTCMMPMVVYALLGGSRTMSVSTTSTVAVLTGSTLVSAGVASNGDDPARDLATLTVLVGVILLLARMLKLGTLIDNISDATLTGIKAGVGLTVAAGQLPKLLGVPGDADADAFFGSIGGVLDDLDQVNGATVALSVATILLLIALGRFAPRVPAPLVGVALGIALVVGWSIDDDGVALVAPVPSGIPLPVAPSLDHVGGLLGGAFAIAIMCFMESASVAGAVRRRHEPPIDNDRELTANGLSCVAGGFFQAMPSAGGFSQTAINQRAGSRTQLSSLVTVALAVACALFLGGVLSDLPEATLGALVVVAVIGLIRPAEFVRYWRYDSHAFWIAATTAAGGLVFGLLAAVLVGVLLTLLLVLRELSRLDVTELRPTSRRDDLVVADPSIEPLSGLLILRIDGPLYTANVRHVAHEIIAAADVASPDVVVLDLSAIDELTMMVADQLGELQRALAAQGIDLWFAALPPKALAMARALPMWDAFEREGRFHETSLAAVRVFAERS